MVAFHFLTLYDGGGDVVFIFLMLSGKGSKDVFNILSLYDGGGEVVFNLCMLSEVGENYQSLLT